MKNEFITVYAPDMDSAARQLEQIYAGEGCVVEVFGDEFSGVWTFEVGEPHPISEDLKDLFWG